jgi:hypothetical protein
MPSKATRKKVTPKAVVKPIKEDYSYVSEEKRSKKKIYILLALIVLIAILVPRITGKSNLAKFKNEVIPSAVKLALNDPTAQFKVGEVKEVSGVYKFGLTINSQPYTSYITKDGKLLFASGFDVAPKPTKKVTATPTPVKKMTCNDLNKAEKPTLTAFVVANCPYGLQMQRVFSKAIGEASGIANYLNVKYIGAISNGKITSMHGDEEAQENLKQICIREEQPALYWSYVSCYMKAEGQSQSCLDSTGVDQISLGGCTQDAQRGLKYAQADFDQANQLGVSGSPTLVLNDKQAVSEFDFGKRTPEVIKQITCCGSKTKPAFCSQAISNVEVAASYSEDGAANQSSNSSASCGN